VITNDFISLSVLHTEIRDRVVNNASLSAGPGHPDWSFPIVSSVPPANSMISS